MRINLCGMLGLPHQHCCISGVAQNTSLVVLRLIMIAARWLPMDGLEPCDVVLTPELMQQIKQVD